VIDLPEAPGKARRPRIPYISALLPLFASVALALVLRSPTFLFFAFLSPVFIAASYLEDRVSGRSERREALKDWRYVVNRSVADLEARLRDEENTPPAWRPRAIEHAIVGRTPMLWERTPGRPRLPGRAARRGVVAVVDHRHPCHRRLRRSPPRWPCCPHRSVRPTTSR
jgi:S-DNA-T family DNA segregation ATPase FtsK/SpoIIIE